MVHDKPAIGQNITSRRRRRQITLRISTVIDDTTLVHENEVIHAGLGSRSLPLAHENFIAILPGTGIVIVSL